VLTATATCADLVAAYAIAGTSAAGSARDFDDFLAHVIDSPSVAVAAGMFRVRVQPQVPRTVRNQ
jgi:hypothetical protein